MGEVLQSEPILRLYEHELIKPSLDDVIEHHGILGMHWGRRNGPPYPLDSSVSTGKRLKGGGNGKISRRKQRKMRKKRVQSLKKARETRAANQEAKRTKEEILKAKDIVSMYRNMDQFTNDEINGVLKRLETENRLRQEYEKAINTRGKRAFKFVKDNASDGAKQFAKETIRNVTKNALKKTARKTMGELIGPELTKELLDGPNKKKKGGGNNKKNKNKKQKSGNNIIFKIE